MFSGGIYEENWVEMGQKKIGQKYQQKHCSRLEMYKINHRDKDTGKTISTLIKSLR